MRLLLDTHIAVWAIANDARLYTAARALIEAPANSIVVSAVSIWEITIKYALFRGRPNDITLTGNEALSFFRGAGFEILPIALGHVIAVADLALHHKDPFDRLLVAQARVEKLRLLTSDRKIAAYGGEVVLI